MAIHAGAVCLHLPQGSRAAIRASQQVVQDAADGDAPVYGVNTGFGKLRQPAHQQVATRRFAVQPDPFALRGRG
jgi:histidine ammonia-lyase